MIAVSLASPPNDLRANPPRNEAGLVVLAKEGDVRSFAELVAGHYSRLLRRSYRITGNWQDAEDAMQFAQMKAFVYLRSFDERSMFSTWFTRIAINAAIGVLRKRNTRCEIPIEPEWNDNGETNVLSILDERSCPETLYREREREEHLRSAIQSLKPLLRDVLDLHYRDQMSMQEIATRLGISVAAAKSRLLRARNCVRQRVAAIHHC